MEIARIRSIVAAPLFGESPKGGWSAEIRPEDSIHALIAVHTEDGRTGYGSVFTDGRLVQAAVQVLEPLWRGENALEPERVSEKLHQNTFWMGRGGTLTHTISGIDIALWDMLGKATGQPVGRLLGGVYRDARAALLLDADGGAGPDGRAWSRSIGRRVSGRSRSAGDRSGGARRQAGRGDRAGGAGGRGPEDRLFVDAGA